MGVGRECRVAQCGNIWRL